jgi:hypothetical protein
MTQDVPPPDDDNAAAGWWSPEVAEAIDFPDGILTPNEIAPALDNFLQYASIEHRIALAEAHYTAAQQCAADGTRLTRIEPSSLIVIWQALSVRYLVDQRTRAAAEKGPAADYFVSATLAAEVEEQVTEAMRAAGVRGLSDILIGPGFLDAQPTDPTVH